MSEMQLNGRYALLNSTGACNFGGINFETKRETKHTRGTDKIGSEGSTVASHVNTTTIFKP